MADIMKVLKRKTRTPMEVAEELRNKVVAARKSQAVQNEPVQNKKVIKFNPDKSVSVNGEVLTAQEYKQYNEQIGRGSRDAVTPLSTKVKSILEKEQQQRALKAENDLITQKATDLAISQKAKALNDKLQAEERDKQFEGQPLVIPKQVEEAGKADTAPNALDFGKIIGGAVAGAGTGALVGGGAGSVVPAVGNVVGAIAGGVIGAIGGAGTAIFYTQADDRKQATKTGYTKFQGATTNMQKIINSLHANQISSMQAKLYWDNEYQRVLTAQQEVENAGKGLFGKKLAKNTDELEKIETWLRRYDEFNAEFQNAAMSPDQSKIINNIAAPQELDTQ